MVKLGHWYTSRRTSASSLNAVATAGHVRSINVAVTSISSRLGCLNDFEELNDEEMVQSVYARVRGRFDSTSSDPLLSFGLTCFDGYKMFSVTGGVNDYLGLACILWVWDRRKPRPVNSGLLMCRYLNAHIAAEIGRCIFCVGELTPQGLTGPLRYILSHTNITNMGHDENGQLE